MKPILFNTEMVRAILDGRKTVTRRVVKFLQGCNPRWTGYAPDGPVLYGSNNIPAAKSPYHTGDILYVRETCQKVQTGTGPWRWVYRADMKDPRYFDDGFFATWRPSIHMPSEAARIFLRVTDVRVERLQDITEDEARKEGAQPVMVSTEPQDTPENERTWHEWFPALPRFIEIWDRTIKPKNCDKYGWGANPWCWVIEFEWITKEEAGGGA